MSLEKIGYNIKYLRRERNGWTQEELAERIGLSRSVIAKWETNAAVPDLEALIKLSQLFNVTIDHIVGNHSFREDLLKDFKRIYSSSPKSFDDEAVELVEYLMENPSFKNQIFLLKNLPFRKQQSLHKMFENMIDNVEKI